jgi:hypothetical protein
VNSVIESLISPDVIAVGDIKVRKPTAGTLAVCDFAKLSILSGSGSEVPFYEALAFFFIHSEPIKKVRELVFDYSLGKNDSGASIAFANAVLDWADDVEIGSINEMGETIAKLINEAMSPNVEPASSADSDVESILSGEEEKKMIAQDS